MKLYSIMLSEQSIQALKRLSEETGLSVSEHIRRAIDIYLYMEHGERIKALAKVKVLCTHTQSERGE